MEIYSDVNDVLRRVADVTEFLGVDLRSVDQVGIFGNTPLAVVITWGDYEAAAKLVEAGANVNARIEDEETALHQAARFNQVEIAELLLAKGATASAKNRDGLTPADLARISGNEELAELLRSCGG